MKHLLIIITLSTFTFMGYATQAELTAKNTDKTTESINDETLYGEHTDEIEEFLSNTPMGSEIYLEQKESGEWYLKVEKTFKVKKNEEKTKVMEPIYGESILI